MVRDRLREVEKLDNFERYFKLEQHELERVREQEQRLDVLDQRVFLEVVNVREACRLSRN